MKLAALIASIMVLAPSSVSAAPWCSGSLEALTMSSWTIEPIDKQNNKLSVHLTSNLDAPVRMLDASAGFVDALGEEIGRFAIDRDAAIPPGGDYEQTGRWGPFTFERLLSLRKDEVATFVCVRAVLFEDGSKREFDTAK